MKKNIFFSTLLTDISQYTVDWRGTNSVFFKLSQPLPVYKWERCRQYMTAQVEALYMGNLPMRMPICNIYLADLSQLYVGLKI
jgi:hypothetical protein